MGDPVPGGLYRVDTVLLSGQDPKPKRPGVVIALPAYGLADVPLLMRTSDTRQRGVFHPKNPSLGLSKDGVFAFKFQRSLDARVFKVSALVEYLGMLEPAYYEQVVRWWEES